MRKTFEIEIPEILRDRVFSLLKEISKNNNVQAEVIESEHSKLDNSEDNVSSIPENDNHIRKPSTPKPRKIAAKNPIQPTQSAADMTSNDTLMQRIENTAIAKAETIYNTQANWLIRNQAGEFIFHLERDGGLRYPYHKRPQDLMQGWDEKLKSQPFWEMAPDYELKNHQLSKRNSDGIPLIFDTSNQWVWQWLASMGTMTAAHATTALEKESYFRLINWTLPNKSSLIGFRNNTSNPARKGYSGYLGYRLFGNYSWICSQGYLDLDVNDPGVDISNPGYILAYNPLPKTNPVDFWRIMREQNMKLAHRPSHDLQEIPDFARYQNTDWQGFIFARLWGELMREGWTLEADGQPSITLAPTGQLPETLLNLDYTPCRLPELDAAQLRDVKKGLWELWGQDSAQLAAFGLRARDPALDVRRQWVAIDFGTSSTVVAVAERTGGKKLLRVGVYDFYAPVEATHFENPTVLEFVHLDKLLQVWNTQVYRPALNWDWVRAAHEALTDYRKDLNNSKMVNSVMLYLKRWVLEAEQVETRLVDPQGMEYRLSPLVEEYPVRGQPMQPRHQAPLDVVELYAWYLGMAINWRQRGLYLRYAMTFPVRYSQDARNKIKAAFSRGLQRSLPDSLIANSEIMNNFEVREVATEPMAYAAAMLPESGLQPTQEGLAYAVFDFGGGTTDFDFGLWRLPTPEEADENGAEKVFERLGAGGDPYLGGENLLALLAYQVFQDNRELVSAKKLVFTRPASEPAFIGSEALVDQSSIAQANTAMLMHALRSLLEKPESFTSKELEMDMLDRNNEKRKVQLALDVDALQGLIRARVERGVEGFLSEMQAAFAEDAPREIHILLAGNASRGRWVREAFDLDNDAWLARVQPYFGAYAPQFEVHFAVGADEAGLEKPNCKTAVAWGALDLVPGRANIQKDRLRARSQGDAPFRYFAGSMVQNHLQPVATPGCAYHEWHEFGVIREGVFTLAWSASPRARAGLPEGDSELRQEDVNFPGAGKGYRCFGRVVSAGSVELAAAASREAFDQLGAGITTTLTLDE